MGGSRQSAFPYIISRSAFKWVGRPGSLETAMPGGKRRLEDHTLAVCELCRSTRFLAAARNFEANLRSIDARKKHSKAVILPHIIFRVSFDVDL